MRVYDVNGSILRVGDKVESDPSWGPTYWPKIGKIKSIDPDTHHGGYQVSIYHNEQRASVFHTKTKRGRLVVNDLKRI